MNPRTLELLEPVGVTERFLANGRRMPALNLWVRGRRVLRSDLTEVPHRFAFMLVQSQADSERLLAEALVERGLRIERGLAVERVDVHDGGVCCDLSDGSRAEADVLLGADGARSKVREQCGIAFEGADGQEPWELHDVDLVGDVLNREEAQVWARTFVPLVAPVVAPLALPAARRFVLGLDHEV